MMYTSKTSRCTVSNTFNGGVSTAKTIVLVDETLEYKIYAN